MTPPTNAEPQPLSREEIAALKAQVYRAGPVIAEAMDVTTVRLLATIEGLRERLARQETVVLASKAAAHHINLDDGSECHYTGLDSGEWYQCDGDCEVAIQLWRNWQAALDALPPETSE